MVKANKHKNLWVYGRYKIKNPCKISPKIYYHMGIKGRRFKTEDSAYHLRKLHTSLKPSFIAVHQRAQTLQEGKTWVEAFPALLCLCILEIIKLGREDFNIWKWQSHLVYWRSLLNGFHNFSRNVIKQVWIYVSPKNISLRYVLKQK